MSGFSSLNGHRFDGPPLNFACPGRGQKANSFQTQLVDGHKDGQSPKRKRKHKSRKSAASEGASGRNENPMYTDEQLNFEPTRRPIWDTPGPFPKTALPIGSLPEASTPVRTSASG